MTSALKWLDQLPRYSIISYNLWRVYRLLTHFGVKYKKLPVFTIAGSNGKGTVAATLAAILTAGGYKVGLYTSPHLETITERINCQGKDIPGPVLSTLLERIRMDLPPLDSRYGTWSHAEIFTLAALMHFEQCHADMLVLEVGLGGRLDPVNIFPAPQATAVTSLTLEHKGILGNTVAEIAAEKAATIKRRRPLITGADGDALAVLEARAQLMAAPVFRWGREFDWAQELLLPDRVLKPLYTPRTGADRLNRAIAAAMAVTVLPDLSDSIVLEGLAAPGLPGRFQELPGEPGVVLDIAHNPQAIANLLEGLSRHYPGARIGFVCGILSDKPVGEMLGMLNACGPVWLAPVRDHRSYKPQGDESAAKAVDSVGEGLAQALDHDLDLVCVTGSFAAVKEAKTLLSKGSYFARMS